jgi:hypothetical protein
MLAQRGLLSEKKASSELNTSLEFGASHALFLVDRALAPRAFLGVRSSLLVDTKRVPEDCVVVDRSGVGGTAGMIEACEPRTGTARYVPYKPLRRVQACVTPYVLFVYREDPPCHLRPSLHLRSSLLASLNRKASTRG